MTTCPKCTATMLPDYAVRYYASAETSCDTSDPRSHCDAWHCLLCGLYLDTVIIENRAKQAQERRLIDQAEVIATWAEFNAPVKAA